MFWQTEKEEEKKKKQKSVSVCFTLTYCDWERERLCVCRREPFIHRANPSLLPSLLCVSCFFLSFFFLRFYKYMVWFGCLRSLLLFVYVCLCCPAFHPSPPPPKRRGKGKALPSFINNICAVQSSQPLFLPLLTKTRRRVMAPLAYQWFQSYILIQRLSIRWPVVDDDDVEVVNRHR